MAFLPTPGGDDGTWGGILNTFLEVTLNADGTLSNVDTVEQVVRATRPDQLSPAGGAMNMNLNQLANCTNSGLVLGSTYFAPGTTATYTINSTTFAAIDTTNLTTPAFVTPTATVLVELTGAVGFLANSSQNSIGWYLFDHGTSNPRGVQAGVFSAAATNNATTCSVKLLVSGLTVGNTYQFDWAWATSGGTAIMAIDGKTGATLVGTGPASMRVIVP